MRQWLQWWSNGVMVTAFYGVILYGIDMGLPYKALFAGILIFAWRMLIQNRPNQKEQKG